MFNKSNEGKEFKEFKRRTELDMGGKNWQKFVDGKCEPHEMPEM